MQPAQPTPRRLKETPIPTRSELRRLTAQRVANERGTLPDAREIFNVVQAIKRVNGVPTNA